jgi:hypothetical protein
MSAVITAPQSRPIDRRSAWILFAAAVLACATVLAVTLVNRQESSPAAVSPSVAKIYSGQLVTGTGPGLATVGQESQLGVASARPLSDAGFEIPAVRDAIPTMRVFTDSKYDFRDLRIKSIRPLSDGSLGGPAAGSPSNENASAVPNCHQCR